ncbi:MAG: hypothetical protein ACR2IE_17000 [Candidatus Sumerlaeaceae bacterium]
MIAQRAIDVFGFQNNADVGDHVEGDAVDIEFFVVHDDAVWIIG